MAGLGFNLVGSFIYIFIYKYYIAPEFEVRVWQCVLAHIVCVNHTQDLAQHAHARGSEVMHPRKIRKFALLAEIKSEAVLTENYEAVKLMVGD